jgi:hypothetical protein
MTRPWLMMHVAVATGNLRGPIGGRAHASKVLSCTATAGLAKAHACLAIRDNNTREGLLSRVNNYRDYQKTFFHVGSNLGFWPARRVWSEAG